MAADQNSQLFSTISHRNSIIPPSSTLLISDADPAIVAVPQTAPAPAALDHINAGAGAARYSLQSNLCACVQTAMHARALNSIFLHGSASESGRELHPSPIPSTSDGDHLTSSTHSSPRTHDAASCTSKRSTLDCATPLQVHVPAAIGNELGSEALLQDHEEEHTSPSMMTTRALTEMQSPNIHARKEESSTEIKPSLLDRKDSEEAEAEVDQGPEEEGCVTPTARDQRIPQYDVELNALSAPLVCPAAPRKKPSASKRRRLLVNYSANIDAGTSAAAPGPDNFNYHVVAERRAFLVDPPDLHTFPDCIRALFK